MLMGDRLHTVTLHTPSIGYIFNKKEKKNKTNKHDYLVI